MSKKVTTLSSSKGFAPILLLVAVVVIAVVAGGAYYFGRSQTLKPQNPVISQTPQPTITAQPTSIPDETANWKTYTSIKLLNNSLEPYSLQYPNSWASKTLRQDKSDTLTLTRGEYVITIYQAPYGGGGCIFEGEMPNGPFEDLRDKKYTEINSRAGVSRRYISSYNNDPNIVRFDFCWQSEARFFDKPTPYGMISYQIPKNYNQSIVEEMDRVIATLNSAKFTN